MDEAEATQAVPKRYRALRIELDTQTPKQSRIIDSESGDELLVEDMQIVCGRATRYGIEVHLVLTVPGGIDIIMREIPE